MTANPTINSVNNTININLDLDEMRRNIRQGVDHLNAIGGIIGMARKGRQAMSDGLRTILGAVPQEQFEELVRVGAEEYVKALPELDELTNLFEDWGIEIPGLENNNWAPYCDGVGAMYGAYPLDVIVEEYGEDGLAALYRIGQDAFERRYGVEALEAAFGPQWSEACRYLEDKLLETARRQLSRRRQAQA